MLEKVGEGEVSYEDDFVQPAMENFNRSENDEIGTQRCSSALQGNDNQNG